MPTDRELLDRRVFTRRVDDGDGAADEVGERDQTAIGLHDRSPTQL